MTDPLTPERRSENMRQIRAKNTAPEIVVRRIVHSMGFRYRLHVSKLPGKPDLVFARLGKIVEVRGCFWHQHGTCIDSHIPKTRLSYWRPKLERNQQRDLKNMRALRSLGFRVLVIWECEITRETHLKLRLKRFLER